MVEELIKKLLEAGVHFGHQTKRWNPKMKKFIFGERSGIYIIDLEKTVECLNAARDFIRDKASKGARILFIGTKKQAQPIIEEEAIRCEMYYVKNRWPGGLLTNLHTVTKSLERLKTIEQMVENGIWERLTKKEIARLTKEKDKIVRDLGGIRTMRGLPQVAFIVDPKREEIAVREARKLKIPIIGLVDTNCDPEVIDFPIPGNDDALKAIRIITTLIADSVIEGRKEFARSEAIKTKVNSEQAGEALEKAPAVAESSSASPASQKE